MRYFFMAALLCCLSASTVHAQSVLENPPGSSTMSGVSLVSGWKCSAGAVTVQFDSRTPEAAAYGTSRPDTQGVCGDQNNGFGLLFNFNRLGDGSHTVKVFDNGVQFGTTTFTVHTLGQEFRTGLSKSVTVSDFPSAGQSTTLTWQESQQNFVIAGTTGGGTGGTLPNVSGAWDIALDYSLETCNFISIPPDLATHLTGHWQVSQSGEDLSVLSGSLTFNGTLGSDGHFTIVTSPDTNSAVGCNYVLVSGFDGNFVNGDVAFLIAADKVSGNCTGVSLPCLVYYKGSVTRANGISAIEEPGTSIEEAVEKMRERIAR